MSATHGADKNHQKGEVTDAQNGEALIGATVMVEGEKGGTVTDF